MRLELSKLRPGKVIMGINVECALVELAGFRETAQSLISKRRFHQEPEVAWIQIDTPHDLVNVSQLGDCEFLGTERRRQR